MPFLQNHIYPLKDPDLFDDDYGEGFDHVLLAERDGAGPDAWVHDAWIVNADGDIHPGYCVSPVPVRRSDVDETLGRPFGHRPVHHVWLHIAISDAPG